MRTSASNSGRGLKISLAICLPSNNQSWRDEVASPRPKHNRGAKYYTDGWGAYERHLDAETHHVGKENTQKIESKHINLRTRIKRLVRRTICFSKTERMHDLMIGLFINRYEFGVAI